MKRINGKSKIKKNLTSNNGITVRPFLRWAGGKQKIVQYLLPFVPPVNRIKKYYEPFIGGGSLFFALQPPNSIISDINFELINCFRQVARYPKEINSLLNYYKKKNTSNFYYKIRKQPLNKLTRKERAARFIYLNKAAFNGLYRVNQLGQFNVPYGPSAKGPAFPPEKILLSASKCLRKSKIKVGDFEDTLKDAEKGDFVYLDPPYPPKSDTAFFTHYSKNGFDWDQQIRVSKSFYDLSKRGCFVMMSNSRQKKITELYSDFNIKKLNVIRWLGSNGDRFKAQEIIVTNYDWVKGAY